MKKKAILACLCASLILSVTMSGCGNDDSQSSESNTGSESITSAASSVSIVEEGDDTVVEEDTDNLYVLKGDLPVEVTKIQEKNYKKGTYNYQYQTEDGMTTIYQVCFENTLNGESSDSEYAEIAAESIVEKECYSITVEENEEYTAAMSYPVYIVNYTTGQNEDTCVWNVYTMVTDNYTYIYGFCTPVDYEEDSEEMYDSVFASMQMLEK